MGNAQMDKSQAGIKITRRNINHLSCADDPTLIAERKEEETFDESKEESKEAGIKFNIQKSKIMASGPITSWEIDGETMETVRLYFWGLQNHCRRWQQPWKDTCSLEEKLWPT